MTSLRVTVKIVPCLGMHAHMYMHTHTCAPLPYTWEHTKCGRIERPNQLLRFPQPILYADQFGAIREMVLVFNCFPSLGDLGPCSSTQNGLGLGLLGTIQRPAAHSAELVNSHQHPWLVFLDLTPRQGCHGSFQIPAGPKPNPGMLSLTSYSKHPSGKTVF